MSFQDVFQCIAVECMQRDSLATLLQAASSRGNNEGRPCFLLTLFVFSENILCHAFFPCRLAALFIQPGKLWRFMSGRKRSRCWRCYKNMMQGSWSIRLIRLFVKVPFCSCYHYLFKGKHQPLYFEDKNMNIIILFFCWVLASCWSLVLRPWITHLQVCEEYWSFPAAATTTAGVEIWIWESKGHRTFPLVRFRVTYKISLQDVSSKNLIKEVPLNWLLRKMTCLFPFSVGLHWGFDF